MPGVDTAYMRTTFDHYILSRYRDISL